MSYGDPFLSIENARAAMTPEQWYRFEAEFEHFKVQKGCEIGIVSRSEQAWARWAALHLWMKIHGEGGAR
jgi:hypothetical protein